MELLSRREDPRMELTAMATKPKQPALHPAVENVAKQPAEPAAEKRAAKAVKGEEPKSEAQPDLKAAAEPAALASEA